jgi:AcrR family transcriptional regulator
MPPVRPPPPPPPGPPPPPRRRYAPRLPPEQRREQLIDATLGIILRDGYGAVTMEAVARAAGVTRPVVYDHFSNLGKLLHALVQREERISLAELDALVPVDPGDADPAELMANSVREFLYAVAARPNTWRLILLPLDGTPAIVRDHVEHNRRRMLRRLEDLVRWASERWGLPVGLDVELAARAIRDLAEEAGRQVLMDPRRFTPERYERFVRDVLGMMWSRAGAEPVN